MSDKTNETPEPANAPELPCPRCGWRFVNFAWSLGAVEIDDLADGYCNSCGLQCEIVFIIKWKPE